MSAIVKDFYEYAPPGVDPGNLNGLLIVIEGPDASGRSTQISLIRKWLEEKGFAVDEVGLKRSELVAPTLEKAQQGNVLSPRTMSLFYATDFYDQMENRIIPALKAGFIVLADRYIFTLMARDIVRGANPLWLSSLYSMAVVPDAVYYLYASCNKLVDRTFAKHGHLDYWESGMDMGLSRYWYNSFVRYQNKMHHEFKKFQKKYDFEIINANRTVTAVNNDLNSRIQMVLKKNDLL